MKKLRDSLFSTIFASLFLFIGFPAFSGPTISIHQLAQEETALKESYLKLNAEKFNLEALITKLNEMTNDADKTAYLKEWQSKVRTFHAQYDSFNEQKMDYILERYISVAREMKASMESSDLYSAATKELLQKKFDFIESQYKRYYDNKGKMGKAQDRDRTLGINHVLNALEGVSREIGRPNRTWGEALRLKLNDLKEKTKFVAGIGAIALALPISGTQLLMGKSILTAAKLPFSMSLLAQNRKLTWNGLENLEKSGEENTLRFLALTHEHNINDFAALTAIADEKTTVISAIGAPEVLGLKKWIDNRPEIITVGVNGDGGRPTDKISQRIKDGTIDTLSIFPEAAMPGYGYELRPAQDSMGTLLKLIKKSGVNIEIVPIAFPRHAQLMNKLKQSSSPMDSRELPVVIGKKIPAPLVNFLIKNGDRATLGDIIRHSWMESFANDHYQDRFMGMPPVKSLISAMDDKLKSRAACKSLSLLKTVELLN